MKEFIRSAYLVLYGWAESFVVGAILVIYALYPIPILFESVDISLMSMFPGAQVFSIIIGVGLGWASRTLGGINSTVLGLLLITALQYSVYSLYWIPILLVSIACSSGVHIDNAEKQGWGPEYLLLAGLIFSIGRLGIPSLSAFILGPTTIGPGLWGLLSVPIFWLSATIAAKLDDEGATDNMMKGLLLLIAFIILIVTMDLHWTTICYLLGIGLTIQAGFAWTKYLRSAASADVANSKKEMNDANQALSDARRANPNASLIEETKRAEKARKGYADATAAKKDPTLGIPWFLFFLWKFWIPGGRWNLFGLVPLVCGPDYSGYEYEASTRVLYDENWNPVPAVTVTVFGGKYAYVQGPKGIGYFYALGEPDSYGLQRLQRL